MKVHCKYDELVAVGELKAHPKNPNKHPKDQIKRLAQVLDYQGWRYPVKVSEATGFVTSGHGRIEAAKLNGWDKVPVNYQEYESAEQEYADVVSDNSIASWAELDLASINAMVPDLGPDFDIDLLGIEGFEIDVADKNDGDADAVPEPPKEAKTKPGELWTLGDHRLLCGDSTKREDVERLMAGEKAELCFTSPPYSDQRDYAGNLKLDPEHISTFIAAAADVVRLFAVNLGLQRRDNEIFQYWDHYISTARHNGLKLLSWNVWDRACGGTIGQQTAMFPIEHEWVFVFGADRIELNRTVENKWAGTQQHGTRRNRDGSLNSVVREAGALVASHRPIGTVYRGDVARFTKAEEHVHPAMFPISFPETYIEAATKSGTNVYEPFCGSGSTLIACEKTNRRCFGMEIDPVYIDVILARWAKFTGKDPIREDGVKWSELKNG